MSNFPAVNGKQVIRALLKLGFKVDRITGSHHVLVKEGVASIPVPVHGSRVLPAGTVASIIRLAGVTRERFFKAI